MQVKNKMIQFHTQLIELKIKKKFTGIGSNLQIYSKLIKTPPPTQNQLLLLQCSFEVITKLLT